MCAVFVYAGEIGLYRFSRCWFRSQDRILLKDFSTVEARCISQPRYRALERGKMCMSILLVMKRERRRGKNILRVNSQWWNIFSSSLIWAKEINSQIISFCLSSTQLGSFSPHPFVFYSPAASRALFTLKTQTFIMFNKCQWGIVFMNCSMKNITMKRK